MALLRFLPACRFVRVIAWLALTCLWASPAWPETVRARRVIDGDTIQLTDGRLVRYIGIDAPEVHRKAHPGDAAWQAGRTVWLADREPFGDEATAANRRLVQGAALTLEYDRERQDRYGRTLAYVYAGPVMVNEALVRQGWARPLAIPPDVTYAERFQALADAARASGRGVWNARVCQAQFGRARCEALWRR